MFVTRGLIDEAVWACGKQARRRGGSLPPHLTVLFLLALALHPGDDYLEVCRKLVAPLRAAGVLGPGFRDPSKSALTQARRRLGEDVMRYLFEHGDLPQPDVLARGAAISGRRAVSIDGMEFEVAATEEAISAFGVHSHGNGLPKARLVSLVDDATRATIAAVISPITGKGSGERTAAGALGEHMCLTADAGFFSFSLWVAAADTGAALIWRVGAAGSTLTPVRDLHDGSHLSLIFHPDATAAQRRRRHAAATAGADLSGHHEHVRVVRVVEYHVDARTDRPLIVAVTTQTDPGADSALDIAVGYHARWTSEDTNKEIKPGLLGPSRPLRSRSPELARQEIWAILLAHRALRGLAAHVADLADPQPDRISFLHTPRLARRHLPATGAFSP